jgi:hypothetical protein
MKPSIKKLFQKWELEYFKEDKLLKRYIEKIYNEVKPPYNYEEVVEETAKRFGITVEDLHNLINDIEQTDVREMKWGIK